MMNRLSLVKKFTLYSFIAFIITSSSLSVILSHYLKNGMELSELIWIVWAVMFLGLIALYAFLIRTVYNASGTLIRQNNELTESKKHLEEAIRKLNFSYRDSSGCICRYRRERCLYSGPFQEGSRYCLQGRKRIGIGG